MAEGAHDHTRLLSTTTTRTGKAPRRRARARFTHRFFHAVYTLRMAEETGDEMLHELRRKLRGK